MKHTVMIWRSWVKTSVGSNLGCIVLLSQVVLEQKNILHIYCILYKLVYFTFPQNVLLSNYTYIVKFRGMLKTPSGSPWLCVWLVSWKAHFKLLREFHKKAGEIWASLYGQTGLANMNKNAKPKVQLSSLLCRKGKIWPWTATGWTATGTG